MQIQESPSSAARRRHHAVQALGKGLARAGLIETTEAACCHPDRHGSPLPGQIVENTSIKAVDAPRCHPAGRTFSHRRARLCLYGDVVRSSATRGSPGASRERRTAKKRARAEHHGRESRSLPDPVLKYKLDQHGKCGRTKIRAALTCGDAEEAFKWKGLEAAGMRSWLPNEEIESPNGKMHISRGGPLLRLDDRLIAAYSVSDRRPGAAAERSSGYAHYNLCPLQRASA